MRKTSITLALAGALATPAIVLAADPTPEHTFAPNVGVVSDYLFRGVSQTHGKPALQAGLDYSHSSGLYAGIWASTITWVKDFTGGGTTEVDLYGGYKNTFAGGDWNYDFGLIHYHYPGAGSATAGNAALVSQLYSPNTTEVYAAIGYKWLTAKYSHTVSSNFIGWVPTTTAGAYDTTKTSRGSNYLELNAAYDLGDGWGVSGHVGHQKVKNVSDSAALRDADYTDWNVGVTKDMGFGVVGLTYSDTNAKGSCSNPLPATNVSNYCWGTSMNTVTPSGYKDVARGTVVLSFKKTF